MHVCLKKEQDSQEFNQNGLGTWDHMVSEDSAERFLFPDRGGTLCPSECSKIQLCGHLEKAETVILTVTDRVFDVL